MGKVNQAKDLLHNINSTMIKLGYSRQERKRVWRDFIKNDDAREAIFDGVIDESFKVSYSPKI